jgi:hypothetical protein
VNRLQSRFSILTSTFEIYILISIFFFCLFRPFSSKVRFSEPPFDCEQRDECKQHIEPTFHFISFLASTSKIVFALKGKDFGSGTSYVCYVHLFAFKAYFCWEIIFKFLFVEKSLFKYWSNNVRM